MLAWLSKSKNPSVSGLIVFGCGYWLDCGCMVLLCVSLCSLFPRGNHAQFRGSSGAQRLRSTLAYCWVERCSDIASCEPAQLQDKYSLVFSCVFTSATVIA